MTEGGQIGNAPAFRGYEPPFVLAIDVGSSSVRGTLFDARARAVEGVASREEHMLHSAADGAAEEIAEHVLERVDRVIDELLRATGPLGSQIAAVGMDTLASTVLGVDSEGHPATPIYTYADMRPSREVDALRRDLDVTAVYQRTGCPLHTAYVPARLLWLRRTLPDIVRRVHHWVDVGTFLYMNWFGRSDVPVSYSIASWSGLLDRHRMRWDVKLLDHLKVSTDMLPGLADYTRPERGLAAPFAGRWPVLRNLPFFLAVGDGAAANVGSGCLGTARVALTVGTSGAIRVLLSGETPEVPSGLWAYRLGATHTLLGGSFNEGGNVFDWAMNTLRLPPAGDLDDALQSLRPDGHGLRMLPFLAGERSPGWSTGSTGVITGLRLSTTPLQILQAALEAVAYRFGMVWDILAPFAEEHAQVIASGGAISRSPYWQQLMADVLQRPVAVCPQSEATSRGTAILALHALGIWPAMDSMPPELGAICRPDFQRAKVYQQAKTRQSRLYDILIGNNSEPG